MSYISHSHSSLLGLSSSSKSSDTFILRLVENSFGITLKWLVGKTPFSDCLLHDTQYD